MTLTQTISVSYRPPATAPRGRWARFLHEMRKQRNWSQQRAFEVLREGLGFGPKSRASYAAIDMGKRPPTTGEAAYLVRYFGTSPDDLPETSEATEPPDALVAALNAIVDRLDRLAAVQVESTDALLAAMAATGRAPAETPSESVPAARADTAQ